MEPHILIVDNDQTFTATMRTAIETCGYKASSVENIENALQFLQAHQVDVVLSDLGIAKGDGTGAHDEIKERFGADTIVIANPENPHAYEEAIRNGASDLVFKPVRTEELVLRLRRVLKERELDRERRLMVEKLQKLAITDGLTKLYNSRHFYHQLEIEVDRCLRYNSPLSLLLMDIDNFKVYNDAYGHLEGDKVLVILGQKIKACLRRADSAYRYGGEEFTVILPETRGDEALAVAKRIGRSINRQEFRPSEKVSVSITISTGLTEYRAQEELTALIQRADKAMYMSKEKGRNRISIVIDDVSESIAL